MRQLKFIYFPREIVEGKIPGCHYVDLRLQLAAQAPLVGHFSDKVHLDARGSELFTPIYKSALLESLGKVSRSAK